MASTAIPSSGVALHGVLNHFDFPRPGSVSAIAFKLGDSVLQDMKKASETKNGLQFVAGSTPKLRIGGRSIDLSLSPELFRNELYTTSSPTSLGDLTFAGLVSHQGELHVCEEASDTADSDAALAALRSSFATLQQEKQANSTQLASSVLPTYRNRFDAARRQKQDRRLINSSSSSLGAVGSPGSSQPTSAPASDASVRQQMKTPLIHLLARGPASTDDIISKTHIPKHDLEGILSKIGTEEGGKWKLSDRAYRDLDVWSFGYPSKNDRDAAINNAIRAYDRQRIGKEEKIWQLLLPKAERNKGKTLSRLHLGVSKGLTPNHPSSPLGADGDGKIDSAANTPRIGAAKSNPSKSSSVIKRLLSKDGGKKARAIEADKERKRKEKEERQAAAASDREGKSIKRAAPRKPETKFKSAEIVHSSDDESDDEAVESQPITRIDSKMSTEKLNVVANSRAKSAAAESDDGGKKRTRPADKQTAKAKSTASTPANSTASPAVKAAKSTALGKITPRMTNTNGLSAPNSQHKSQLSPQKPDSRPTVPSPLGAARPRVASDISDRGAIGVQRTKHGAGTPKGLGITNGVRRRQDTVTSTDSVSSASEKRRADEMAKTRKMAANGVSISAEPPAMNGTSHKTEQSLKRKNPPADTTLAPTKHRKTEPSSSDSHKSHSSLLSNGSSISHTSPDFAFETHGGNSSDSAASVLDTITYAQGVTLAERFRGFYPKYEQMYEALRTKQERRDKVGEEEKEKLWAMHKRLEEMKRQIERASLRGGED